MSKKVFGGKHTYMTPSSKRFISKNVWPGVIQSIVFKEDDPRSFCAKERLLQRNNEIQPGTKNRWGFRKDELVKKVLEAGVTEAGNYAAIQKLDSEKNTIIWGELTCGEKKVGEKYKGIYQVFWERGFLDQLNLNQCIMDAKKLTYSLKQILWSFKYFQEEEMLLQTIHWESNCSKENIRVLIVMTFPGHAYQYLDLSVVAVTKQYKHPPNDNERRHQTWQR